MLGSQIPQDSVVGAIRRLTGDCPPCGPNPSGSGPRAAARAAPTGIRGRGRDARATSDSGLNCALIRSKLPQLKNRWGL